MSRPCRLEPEASAELEEAALWYESRRQGLGFDFLQAIDTALEQIARWPEAGARVPDLPADVPARRVPVTRFPYHVVYLDLAAAIRVLAIAHDHREPGYWRSRSRR